MAGLVVPIDEVVHFDVVTHSPTTGAATDADSAPVFSVYEEDTDTALTNCSAVTMTKRTSLTGNYRGSFTASAANGFEAGKWYSAIVSATVGSVSGKTVAISFRCVPAETAAGVPKTDPSHWGGTAVASATVRSDLINIAGAAVNTASAQLGVNVVNFGGSAGTFASGRPDVNATHWAGNAITAGSIPAAQAGAANGLVIAGNNAPITFTGSGNAFSCISTGGNGVGMVITGHGSGLALDINGGSTSGSGIDVSTGTNGTALRLTGNGSGHGIDIDGGSGGDGINILGGSFGVYVASGNNSAALRLLGHGSGAGLHATSATTGSGILVAGGATSGNGITVTTTNGHAVSLDATGASKYGLDIDTITASGAMTITGGITANITGNLSGSIGSVGTGGITASSIATGAIDADALAADTITAAKIATGALTSTKFDTGAITAAALASDAANEIADAVLTRNASNVESTAGEHTLCTVVLAMLEHSISGTTLTIKRTDGSTTHYTKTLTTNASADPITGIQ